VYGLTLYCGVGVRDMQQCLGDFLGYVMHGDNVKMNTVTLTTNMLASYLAAAGYDCPSRSAVQHAADGSLLSRRCEKSA